MGARLGWTHTRHCPQSRGPGPSEHAARTSPIQVPSPSCFHAGTRHHTNPQPRGAPGPEFASALYHLTLGRHQSLCLRLHIHKMGSQPASTFFPRPPWALGQQRPVAPSQPAQQGANTTGHCHNMFSGCPRTESKRCLTQNRRGSVPPVSRAEAVAASRAHVAGQTLQVHGSLDRLACSKQHLRCAANTTAGLPRELFTGAHCYRTAWGSLAWAGAPGWAVLPRVCLLTPCLCLTHYPGPLHGLCTAQAAAHPHAQASPGISCDSESSRLRQTLQGPAVLRSLPT